MKLTAGCVYRFIIDHDDLVLDIGSGNGIRTVEISKTCKPIIGIDFSESLIKIKNCKKYNESF